MAEKKTCPQCGAPAQENADVCDYCGAPLRLLSAPGLSPARPEQGSAAFTPEELKKLKLRGQNPLGCLIVLAWFLVIGLSWVLLNTIGDRALGAMNSPEILRDMLSWVTNGFAILGLASPIIYFGITNMRNREKLRREGVPAVATVFHQRKTTDSDGSYTYYILYAIKVRNGLGEEQIVTQSEVVKKDFYNLCPPGATLDVRYLREKPEVVHSEYALSNGQRYQR